MSAARLVRVVRRLHLFAGLAMLPWVTLYGTTALLFNHPSVLRPADRREPDEIPVGDSVVLGVGRATLLRSVQQAMAVAPGAPRGTLIGPVRGAAEFTIRAHDTVWTVSFDVDHGTARVFPMPRRRASPGRTFRLGPLRAGGVLLTPESLAVRAAEALHSARGGPGGGGTYEVRGVPEPAPRASLAFAMQGADTLWLGSYDLATGEVTVSPQPGRAPLGIRDLLTSFHKRHEYPSTFGAGWVWAMFVDAMACLLLYWATSGLVMWWQYASLRRVGGLILGASACVAMGLAVALYHAMSASP